MFKVLPLLQVLLFSLFFSMTACADNPDSPVAPTEGKDSLGDNENHEEENAIIAMAVKYEGKDSLGRKCDFYVSIEEEEKEGQNDHGHEHHHHMLMKVDYATLDGHKPHAGEAEFYLYDSANGVYYDEDSNQPGTTLSLLSLSMVDPNVVPDVNLINDYLANVELEQYLRVEFVDGSDAEAFEEALDEVLEGNSDINDKLDVFNTVQLINMGTLHGDHYHFPTCSNYKPVSVEETEFELEGHDHNHDDDHHDHDHE